MIDAHGGRVHAAACADQHGETERREARRGIYLHALLQNRGISGSMVV